MKIDDEVPGLRQEYEGEPLDEGSVDADPFVQFQRWFDDAVRAEVPLANGMTLATVRRDGQPSARIVLLKEVDERGFVFFTNYNSAKGEDLAHNRRAALLFWWVPLQRQVRIEGLTSIVEPALSDEYFTSRPRSSNLSAIASPQSEIVAGRSELEARVAELESSLDGAPLARPNGWGGYRLVPARFEFWQGRRDRLHDRICYRRSTAEEDSAWAISRLAP